MIESKFNSAIVKIGNSYAIRIPINILKELNATEGDSTLVKISKISFDLTPEIESYWLKKAKECKEMKQFSDEKLRLLARLSYNEGKEMNAKLNGKQRAKVINLNNNKTETLNNKDLKEMKSIGNEAQKEYREQIRKEFGDKIYEEFLYFRKIVDPKFK
jgi:antitoxin component of MazEF toxin-antitoxin module